MILRRAAAADAEDLAAVATAAYSAYLPRMGGVRPGPLDADYAAVVATREVWLAGSPDREVMGFVVLGDHEDGMLLENLAVDPAHQGGGIGVRLLAHAEDRARVLGARAVHLYTHVTMTGNQRWYERHGYVEHRRAVDDGLERVFYVKRLDDT